MASLLLTVVTPEREVLRRDGVESVVAPGVDGELGILPRHAPLITQLQPGTLRLRQDGDESYLAITGGFLEVMDNRVTVLADASERSEEINLERARQAREIAQQRLDEARLTFEGVDTARARMALLRALARLRTAERARRR